MKGTTANMKVNLPEGIYGSEIMPFRHDYQRGLNNGLNPEEAYKKALPKRLQHSLSKK